MDGGLTACDAWALVPVLDVDLDDVSLSSPNGQADYSRHDQPPSRLSNLSLERADSVVRQL